MTDPDHHPDARLIIANLDCEESWDREQNSALAPGDPLPLHLRRELAALGTLLRCLGREGDVVWTALPVRADRLIDSSALGLPHTLQQSVAWPVARPREVLAWGETAAVRALRLARPSERPRALPPRVSEATPIALVERLWALPPAGPGVAARVNHRLQQLALAERLGLALPGARPIDSLAALDAAVTRLPRDAEGRWVLKSPLSAAGRGRVLGGTNERAAAQRERAAAERLLGRHGTLLFEPWMPRTDDLGCCALLGEGALEFLGLHRLSVTPRGGFRAVTLPPAPGLDVDDEGSLRQVAERVGEHLHVQGYRGPFGLDAWRYRDRHGRLVLHPLGELNARLTFGLITRVLAERLAAGAGRRSVLGLRLGRTGGRVPTSDAGGAGPTLVPLLAGSSSRELEAWVEVSSPARQGGVGGACGAGLAPTAPSLRGGRAT